MKLYPKKFQFIFLVEILVFICFNNKNIYIIINIFEVPRRLAENDLGMKTQSSQQRQKTKKNVEN